MPFRLPVPVLPPLSQQEVVGLDGGGGMFLKKSCFFRPSSLPVSNESSALSCWVSAVKEREVLTRGTILRLQACIVRGMIEFEVIQCSIPAG